MVSAFASVACVAVLLSACASGSATARNQTPRPVADAQPLAAILGEWQSDTVGGAAARSDCAWSPQGSAVICEQTITSSAGVRHAVNVFTSDRATGRHYYYGIVQPGEPAVPTPLQINAHVWTYGGNAAGPNGQFVRTVNDFSVPGKYTWRTETSGDGTHWNTVRQGNVRSVRSN